MRSNDVAAGVFPAAGTIPNIDAITFDANTFSEPLPPARPPLVNVGPIPRSAATAVGPRFG